MASRAFTGTGPGPLVSPAGTSRAVFPVAAALTPPPPPTGLLLPRPCSPSSTGAFLPCSLGTGHPVSVLPGHIYSGTQLKAQPQTGEVRKARPPLSRALLRALQGIPLPAKDTGADPRDAHPASPKVRAPQGAQGKKAGRTSAPPPSPPPFFPPSPSLRLPSGVSLSLSQSHTHTLGRKKALMSPVMKEVQTTAAQCFCPRGWQRVL